MSPRAWRSTLIGSAALWVLIAAAVLLLTTGCKQLEPAPKPTCPHGQTARPDLDTREYRCVNQ